jgi:hypothetical protein
MTELVAKSGIVKLKGLRQVVFGVLETEWWRRIDTVGLQEKTRALFSSMRGSEVEVIFKKMEELEYSSGERDEGCSRVYRRSAGSDEFSSRDLKELFEYGARRTFDLQRSSS